MIYTTINTTKLLEKIKNYAEEKKMVLLTPSINSDGSEDWPDELRKNFTSLQWGFSYDENSSLPSIQGGIEGIFSGHFSMSDQDVIFYDLLEWLGFNTNGILYKDSIEDSMISFGEKETSWMWQLKPHSSLTAPEEWEISSQDEDEEIKIQDKTAIYN